jgi:transcriptional regulator with XRE-family HTH domain
MSEKDRRDFSPIGKKLRTARLRRRLSLRELAERAEVSASLLSKVENGKANPSVRSLHSIAEALVVPVNYFFPEDENRAMEVEPGPEEATPSEPISVTASQMRAIRDATLMHSAQFGIDSSNHHSKGPVVRGSARPTIELLGGINWERLTPGPENGIEFLHISYNVGAKSGEKMSHHSGREFQFVLEGELLLELGFERYLLKAGDSIIFDSATPHRLSNAGNVPMQAISIIFNQLSPFAAET